MFELRSRLAGLGVTPSIESSVVDRGDEIFEREHRLHCQRTDRLFAWLMVLQWVAGIVVALVISPKTWEGAIDSAHIHVWTAVLVGGSIAALPIALAILRPGERMTRYVIAAGQMLASGLLIHLSGGRIETHFHVFGSLAFLSFYRDWRVLVPATVVVALDHMLRGAFWPQSVFGVATASQWRWAEHAAWVLFENYFLVRSCRRSAAEMRATCGRQAQLEATNRLVEAKVDEQTAEIAERESLFRSLTQSSPIGVFRTEVDPMRIDFANKRCSAILAAEVEDICAFGWWHIVHPDDRSLVTKTWREATGSGRDYSREFRISAEGESPRWIHLRATPLSDGNGYVGTIEDISERRAADEERARLTAAVEHAADAVMITDTHGVIEYVNPAFEYITGYNSDDTIGQTSAMLESGQHGESFYRGLRKTIESGRPWSGQFVNKRKDGSVFESEATISAILDVSGQITNYVEVIRDVTEQKTMERQLGQSQKLESIGQLAAGIAHEINTPTQYVSDNTRFLEEAFEDLLRPLKKVRGLIENREEGLTAQALDELGAAIEEADVDFLVGEIPRAIEQSLEGVGRVTQIVRSMKEFSHPSDEASPTDLNRAIESTVTVARNEWKYVAEVEMELDASLGTVCCFPGDVNQVVLNMIVNAAHAIAEVVGEASNEKGVIRIRTRKTDEWAEIEIGDTGCGIPEENQERVFDPFFTTKEVGKGTGQGLSIAHKIIVGKHGGQLDVESETGVGTTFTLRLPLEWETSPAETDA